MSPGIWFWIIMVVVLLFGFILVWPVGALTTTMGGVSFIVWILFALIGWKVFGPPIQ
jgi:hypothetical protein